MRKYKDYYCIKKIVTDMKMECYTVMDMWREWMLEEGSGLCVSEVGSCRFE